MARQNLLTSIGLPSGVPSSRVIQELFQLAFEEYRWFRPARYGRASLDQRLDPARTDYAALISYYEEHQSITIAARSEQDYLMVFPAKKVGDLPGFTGDVAWSLSVKEESISDWSRAHTSQVARLMGLLGAPLAQTCVFEELERKTGRWVHDGLSQVRVSTVRGYSEGLAGLFWRNFFGPPFVRMFGERLISLPGEFKQELGSGIVLVQPYELPTQAGTPEGDALERQLIAHLGPECFYEHERHLKPTRVPELPTVG